MIPKTTEEIVSAIRGMAQDENTAAQSHERWRETPETGWLLERLDHFAAQGRQDAELRWEAARALNPHESALTHALRAIAFASYANAYEEVAKLIRSEQVGVASPTPQIPDLASVLFGGGR